MFSDRSREAIRDFFQYHIRSLIAGSEEGICIFLQMHRSANLHIKKKKPLLPLFSIQTIQCGEGGMFNSKNTKYQSM